MKAVLSLVIFTITYILIVSEKINKTILAVTAALCAIIFRLISFSEAVERIDWNVIFLLVGMMICAHILSRTGFFEWVAISIAKKAKGEPLIIMLFLLVLTAVFSAFLDNVTTIILIVPVTILITQLLELSPVPFIILEVLSSNIGGTATLIGDPPNIIIGSKAALSFNAFIFNLGPVILLVFIVFLMTVRFIFRSRIRVEPALKKRVTDALPHLAIIDKKNMIRALIVFGAMFIGFFIHGFLKIEPGIIAFLGSMVMLLVTRQKKDEVFSQAEWGVILFFVGMFMLVASLEVNGVISSAGKALLGLGNDNLFLICILILWGSAIFSAILDNIPFVMVMVPLVKEVNGHFALGNLPGSMGHLNVLWWALALGVCLGGNGTLIGASANIVMARIAEKNKCPVSFGRFFKYGAGYLFQSLIICTLYLWLRYFLF